jgi:hypothetical protein
MIPQEKAKELVNKFNEVSECGIWNGTDIAVKLNIKLAKQCALIAVEFAKEFITGDLNESFDKTMYLFEVKQELEKL